MHRLRILFLRFYPPPDSFLSILLFRLGPLGPILASRQFPVKAGRTEYRLWPSAEAEMAALEAQAATRYDERKRGAARRPFFISLQDPVAQNSFLSSIDVASSPLAPGTTRM